MLSVSRRPLVRTGLIVVVLGALVATVLLTMAANAQDADQVGSAVPIADVSGPGQAVPQPPAECPRTVSCAYTEQNLLPDGYRLQSLRVCGANCTTQYWVSSRADGQQLLEIDPVRGGALVAVSHDAGNHPGVRVVMPLYAAGDAACCPSSFSDTTFSWDEAANTLVAAEPVLTPADQFPGYDATRQELLAEGWLVATI